MEDYPAMKSREVNHRETTKKKGNKRKYDLFKPSKTGWSSVNVSTDCHRIKFAHTAQRKSPLIANRRAFLCLEKWYARQDSNLQPLGSKPSTLSIELRAHLMSQSSRISSGASDGIRTRDLLCHRQAP